jgi:signal transduction histidine kinase
MSFVAMLTVGLAVFAWGTAAFNLWIFWMRPREAAHLWLGIASVGVMWLSVGLAAAFEAQSVAQAQSALLLALGGALPFAAGFVRFSQLFAGIEHPLLRGYFPYAALVTAATYANPKFFFSGEGVEIESWFGHRYVQAGLSPWAGAIYAGFAVMILGVVAAYARRVRQIEGGPLITGALGVWAACMINDMCVGLRLYWAPWLLPVGFAAFSAVFAALLLRRLVHSQGHVERSAGELHALVETRTGELRRKDLELAHGARLATLGALAGGIAHEVEEPLAAIDARVKELRHAWRDPTRPGAFAALLQDALRSVERIRAVVAELLQLARREEGQRGTHQLPEIVASVLPIASYELRRRARLETHFMTAPCVYGDAAMLSQIALNLLVGAIHAFPESPRAEHARISLTTDERDGRASLEVEDNAPSLPSDAASDLFELTPTSGAERERRLGLAVTKQLVERHGGSLEIESGSFGTRIRVLLPGALPEGAAP